MIKALFNSYNYRVLSASFLVAGSCIGGGILGVPVEAGAIGFYPSAIMLLSSWLFMTLTAFLYAEASLWMKDENAHVVSIAKHLLGRFGEIVAVILYIFMGYASLVSYNSGGSQIIQNLLANFGISFSTHVSAEIYAAVFGIIFYFGARVVGFINMLLMFGLIGSYVFMVGFGFSGVRSSLLSSGSWSGFYTVIPLMITSFSFQMIIPTITLYVDRDAKSLRLSMLIGTFLALVFYLLWIFVVMGTVPNVGENGLEESLKLGRVATTSLRIYAHRNVIGTLGEFFAFFAITTSYLGIGLGLYDFLADLFSIQKKKLGKCMLCILVVLPTLYITLIFPNTFLEALDITGGLGDSILNGILAVMMVWMGRYVIGYKSDLKLFGGKLMLILLIISSFLIITSQILKWVL